MEIKEGGVIESCIFCKIIKGEIPCYKIYEDDKVFAFLDIHPINPGHILVIPKSHVENFYDLSDEIYDSLWKSVKDLSLKVKENIKPVKVGIIVAGFDVPHAHVHIVPMNEHHDITSKSIIDGTRSEPTNEDLIRIQKVLTL